MAQTYTHILTFLFKHQYFSDKLFKTIDITIDEKTTKLLRNLDVIIKPFPGGFYLLASNPDLLDLSTETPIRLYLNCKDNLYINYTELPSYSPAGMLLYFNNLTVSSNPNSDSFNLHNNEFVGENEVVQLSNGKINIPQFDSGKKYLFTDAAGNEISSPYLTQSANSPGEFILNDLPEGLVTAKMENEEVGRVYYNPKPVWKKPLGILEIFPDKLFKHYKEKGKVEYAVNFVNRETIWKYFLVGPVFQKFNNLSIINKAKEQIFNAVENQQISENYEALVFDSKNTIPISELSNETFQLVDNFDPELKYGKVILKNLPFASAEQLYRDGTDSDGTIYSHIYI